MRPSGLSKRLFWLLLLPAGLFLGGGCDSTQSKSANSPGAKPGSTAPASAASAEPIELLNVSYDPTRELWKDLNEQFIADYKTQTGGELSIKQSHAGSSAQARAVIEGLEADVVTLAMSTDTDAIRKAGLISEGWDEKLPNGSLPYSSTIVFVVRKGNPRKVKDWKDLIAKDVAVITPNPKTSGNGKLSFLSAWGSVVVPGGTEEDAQKFVTELYKHVPVLDSGARGATTTFAQKGLGDVHLTWENEAYLEVAESGDALEIVYPPLSIRAEPRVAVVDANVDRRGTRDVATAYLKFLYSDAGQQTLAKHHYRPSRPEILEAHNKTLPKIELFSIKQIAKSWEDAEQKFFAADGVFDQVYSPESK
jgi:sulfate/thiosulfate transport system substrate-binding protein